MSAISTPVKPSSPRASPLDHRQKQSATRRKGGHRSGQKPAGPPPESKILFQQFFKSVGPRTYAAQIKELSNGNHLLVLTEGKRDEATDEVRKTRLFVFGEDFSAFFRLLHETAVFIRANPVSSEVRKRRDEYWIRKSRDGSRKKPTRT